MISTRCVGSGFVVDCKPISPSSPPSSLGERLKFLGLPAIDTLVTVGAGSANVTSRVRPAALSRVPRAGDDEDIWQSFNPQRQDGRPHLRRRRGAGAQDALEELHVRRGPASDRAGDAGHRRVEPVRGTEAEGGQVAPGKKSPREKMEDAAENRLAKIIKIIAECPFAPP